MDGAVTPGERGKTVAETIQQLRICSFFSKALQQADLRDLLMSSGPFTVFVPHDDAFRVLAPQNLALLFENRFKLNSVLTYHIIFEKFMSADLKALRKLETLEGGFITLDSEEKALINGASIIRADVECDNGVIHIVDTLLHLHADAAAKQGVPTR